VTLDTKFVIDHPVPAKEVFDFCREMIGATDDHAWKRTDDNLWENPGYHNVAGQGLPALLYVSYGADGPLLETAWDEGDEEYVRPHQPPGSVKVSLDTPYGYHDELGRGCGQLHAYYVTVLGRWCEKNGWAYHWQDESTGDWYSDWRRASDVLGEAGDAASQWFRDTVFPALASEAASR